MKAGHVLDVKCPACPMSIVKINKGIKQSCLLLFHLSLQWRFFLRMQNKRCKMKWKPYIEVIEDSKGTEIVPDILIFALDTAKSFKKGTGPYSKFETTALMIKAEKDTDVVSMVVDLKKLNEGLRVDVIEQDEFVKGNMSSLAIFIIVMSVLIMIVTSLMVVSNFDLILRCSHSFNRESSNNHVCLN